MATVEKRGNSWRLVAYLGYDELGIQIKRRTTIPAEGVSKAEDQVCLVLHPSVHNGPATRRTARLEMGLKRRPDRQSERHRSKRRRDNL